jgi:Virulence factor BrkB
MLAFVTLVVATLYYAAPNVQLPKFRWANVGAAVAILGWILASVLFGFYVANFGSYNKTYNALAGVVAFLLWLWITNLALLFGADWTLNSSVDANCRRVSPPNAICNCPAATAGSSTRTRPNKNGTSNAPAHCGNAAAGTADGPAAFDQSGAEDFLRALTSPSYWLAQLLRGKLELERF